MENDKIITALYNCFISDKDCDGENVVDVIGALATAQNRTAGAIEDLASAVVRAAEIQAESIGGIASTIGDIAFSMDKE